MDYEKLGFKCGIEIHQQLAGKKLFCNCPAINSTKEPDIKVERRLRAVAGETGEIDAAAMHEMHKAKKFIYIGDSEDTCLVELDEEPPHPMNQDALKAGIEVAMLLNAKIVDEIQIMRKTVVDGSNTTGFQRTALVGYDGYVETSLGKVGITNICVEEEACQKVKETKDSTTYRLDRLGIALIEIGTAADIKNAEHAKETAEKLGMILRSTGKVKRGLGTIRQDVNISIKGGARTEVKGFQDLRSIPKVIEHEVERQQALIKKHKKIKQEVRKAEPDFTTSFLRPMPGAARMYPETDVVPLRADTKNIKLPELIEDRAADYQKKLKLGADLAKAISRSDKSSMFASSAAKFSKIKPAFIAETLMSYEKELRKNYKDADAGKVNDADFEKIFSALDKSDITKGFVLDALADIALGKKLNLDKYKTASTADLEKEIKAIVEKNKGAPFGALMGIVMKKYHGKVDGKTVNEILRKYVK